MKANDRETGARKLEPHPRRDQTDQNAGMPMKPRPYGLTEPVDDPRTDDRPDTAER
ncbi:hypothetical protein [Aquibium carbonis]|uniref:hypothetical protein n=1 Tax=Aquibium carbonis TaxID=2495581 RepID=UPI001478ABC4|nr:hypothetical protein [Aquibium carbonis]